MKTLLFTLSVLVIGTAQAQAGGVDSAIDCVGSGKVSCPTAQQKDDVVEQKVVRDDGLDQDGARAKDEAQD